MYPDYITEEISRRSGLTEIMQSEIAGLAGKWRINLDASMTPHPTAEAAINQLRGPPLDHLKLPLSGVCEFELWSEIYGARRRSRARIVFAGSLHDQDGERVIDTIVSRYEVLSWGDDAPAPYWEPLPDYLMSEEADNVIWDQVQWLMIDQERRLAG